jgi:peptide/nickel transport system permease protein
MLALVALIALLAPLLADNKPLLMRSEGRWSSPVARAMLHPVSSAAPGVNAVFNAPLLVLPTALLVTWLVRTVLRRWPGQAKRGLAFSEPHARAEFTRRGRRWRICAAGTTLLAVALLSVWLLRQRPINFERFKYKERAAAAAPAEWFVFPPIRFSPINSEREPPLAPASWRHPLGTDTIGRDVLSRIIHGARISLAVGLASVAVAMLIGVTLGALAGYFRGWIDALITRVIEVFLCFPVLILILTLMAFWSAAADASLLVIMLVIGLTGWTKAARQVRGEFLRQRSLDYVAAAEAVGVSPLRIVFVHILPNAIQPALVTATFGVAAAILYESTLSFLGLGVPPPAPSWGGMLFDASRHVASHPQLAVWPGLAIFLTIVSYNLVGEGLRDALDPRLRQ